MYRAASKDEHHIQKQVDDMHKQLKAIIIRVQKLKAMQGILKIMMLINKFFFEISICIFILRILSLLQT